MTKRAANGSFNIKMHHNAERSCLNTSLPLISRPLIGITFLDKNNFGLKKLFELSKKEKDIIDKFYNFLEKSRKYENIGKLIKTHASHIKTKSNDEKSKNKAKELREQYNLEVEHLIHLHCLRDGHGEFVLHGFQIGNHFEIVWIDPKHEIHS